MSTHSSVTPPQALARVAAPVLERLPVSSESAPEHPLRAKGRPWPEMNCYIDVWVSLLAGYGLNPSPAGAAAFSSRMHGDSWTFLKYPNEDVSALYGIETEELGMWSTPLHHAMTQMRQGNLVTIEADSFFLPDTVGVSYRQGHTKSTIVPLVIDAQTRRMRYIHNAGCFELEGEDFEHVIGEPAAQGLVAFPYVEVVAMEGLTRLDEAALRARAREVLRRRLPAADADPVAQLGVMVAENIPVIQEHGPALFHELSFATLRQCGVCAMVAADTARWHDPAELGPAADLFLDVSRLMTQIQFKLARAAAGRKVDVTAQFESASRMWNEALARVRDWAHTRD